MRKTYCVLFSIILALLISSFISSQTTVFEDKFDTYTAGQKLACQNSVDWTTWSLIPCDTIEDAFVSNIHSLSGSNSVVIVQNNDLVRRYGSFTSGICDISFQIYIPSGKAGYFNTLAIFTPPSTFNWAMQCWFDASGVARLDAAGVSAATFTYNHDSWQEVRLVVDLEMDIAKFWFNTSLIRTWQWTRGWSGSSGSSPLRLDATDLFGATPNDEMYVDDYLVTYYPKIISTASGGNWNSPGTWVGGIVPISGNPVEIVSTATVNLDNNISRDAGTLINGILNCGTNIISGAGSFTLSPGAYLGIGSTEGISASGTSGNIQVTGIRTFSTGANYVFIGSTAQITGNGLPATVNNLTINNIAGVTLSSSTSNNGILTLSNGNLNTTSSNILTVGTTGNISGGSSASYVDGPLAYSYATAGSKSFTYPIGKGGTYKPVTLSLTQSSATASTYTAEMFMTVPPSYTFPGSIDAVSTIRYYNISEGGGGSAFTGGVVVLNYGSDDGVSDEPNLRVAKSDGAGNWVDLGPIAGGSSGTIISSAPFTDLTGNVFVLANATDGGNPLPIEFISLKASANKDVVELNWKTATEIENAGFDIERTSPTLGMKWENIGFVKGSGNSNSIKEYSYQDKSPKFGKYQYRLKQINTDGTYEYSKVVDVTVNRTLNLLVKNYPNPFNPTTKIIFEIPNRTNVNLSVYNLIGQKIATLVDEHLEQGVHERNFNAENLPTGIYIYTLKAGETSITNKMILVK